MKSITHFALVFSLARVLHAAPAASSDPVCVVGAGPAGLAAANSLEAKGKTAIIFEKLPEVGGKCQAFYDQPGGTFHPLGALLYSNLTYTSTLPIINSVSVPSREFSSMGSGPSWNYDFTTGTITPRPTLDPEFVAQLTLEIIKYSAQWTVEFYPLFGNVGYKNPVPAKFAVTTRQWMNSNGYKALQALFVSGMTAYGYGDPSETPILYMLQYFTPDIVTFFANLHHGYVIDFHKVFVQYSQKHIKSPIKLSTTITKIDRSSGHPVITYKSDASASQTQSCSAVILAFPPTIANLKAANLDISTAETGLFSSLITENYYSSAVRVKTPDDFVYSAKQSAPDQPPPAVGEPVAFIRLFDSSNVATVWSWDALNSTQTPAQVRQRLITTLSKVNKDPRLPDQKPALVTSSDVVAFRKWDYFPRVSAAELGKGWYQRFNKQQGAKQTYFASGLNGFETVEFSVRAGRDIVKSFF